MLFLDEAIFNYADFVFNGLWVSQPTGAALCRRNQTASQTDLTYTGLYASHIIDRRSMMAQFQIPLFPRFH